MSARLPGRFWLIWTGATVSALGDGVRTTALPLLAATLTRDPRLVAAVTVAGSLPWLLFALVSGALVDRWDRRRVMWAVDSARGVVMAVLAVVIVTGQSRIAILTAVAFLLGSGETLFDNAAQSIMPTLVGRERLELANSRLYAAQSLTGQLAGPPLGAFLFSIALAVPSALDSVSFFIAAGLAFSIAGHYRAPQDASQPRHLGREIGVGLAWLWRHRLIRQLAFMLGCYTLVSSAGSAISVLWALEVLHITAVGYGLLFTVGAVGGILCGLVAPRIIGWLGAAHSLLVSLVLACMAFVSLAVTRDPVVAGAAFFVNGATVILWNVVTVSLRQQLIPDHLIGRVNSVYRLIGWGGMPVGALIGGIMGASAWGLRSPFWLEAGMAAALALTAALTVNETAIAAARAQDAPG